MLIAFLACLELCRSCKLPAADHVSVKNISLMLFTSHKLMNSHGPAGMILLSNAELTRLQNIELTTKKLLS